MEKEVVTMLEKFSGKELFNPSVDHLRPFFNKHYLDIKSKIITVGGTNGKGQVSMQLHHLANLHKIKVATFISPHVDTIRERIITDSKYISYQALIDLFDTVKKKLTFAVSFYELLFLIFCEHLLITKPDLIILEVGLGGRLDAVNLFNNDLSIITSISRDHQSILGNSYHKILLEKLAIVRKKLITSLELKYLRTKTYHAIKSKNIDWVDMYSIYPNFYKLNYIQRNNLLTIFAFNHLGYNLPLDPNYSFPILPGRFSTYKNYTFVGSHNPDGIRKLVDLIRGEKWDRIIAAFSKRDLLDIHCMIDSLLLLRIPLIITKFDHFKGFDIQITRNDIEWVTDWDKLTNQHEKTLVTGSFYFTCEFRSYLSRRDHLS